jgi:Ca2+-dependent lipid-binding protein
MRVFTVNVICVQPDIDASLTAIGGIDILSIPRVKGLLLHVIQSVLADVLLWPRRFLLALQHEALAGEKHAVGTITLHILHARGLYYHGLGSPSPYLKVLFTCMCI